MDYQLRLLSERRVSGRKNLFVSSGYDSTCADLGTAAASGFDCGIFRTNLIGIDTDWCRQGKRSEQAVRGAAYSGGTGHCCWRCSQ